MLDVVVEFSSIITNDSLSFYMQPVTYEGIAVPGSPFEVIVAPNPAQILPQVACTGAEIGEASGTWVLDSMPNKQSIHPIDFVAADFKWQPDACSLPSLDCLILASAKGNQTCLPAGHKAMVYALGDSVMRIQTYSLATLLGEDTTTGYTHEDGSKITQTTERTIFHMQCHATYDGMLPRMRSMKQAIDDLVQCQLTGTCVPILLFNSGLHDLQGYCGPDPVQLSPEQSQSAKVMSDCVSSYAGLLQEIVDYARNSGLAGVRVFRSTAAAWLRYGNHRINWFDPDKRNTQIFVRNWFSVVKFNEIAVPIFKKAGWHIIDAFQSSIGRPDHTEKNSNGAFVHFEHEVPDLHNHQFLSIIFENMCPSVSVSCAAQPHQRKWHSNRVLVN